MNSTTLLSGVDLLDNFFNYIKEKIGTFSSVGSYDFTGFINVTDPSAKYPNIQFTHETFTTNDLRMEILLDDLKEPIRKQIKEVSDVSDTVVVNVVLLKPKSRGKVRLVSTIPVEKPKVIAGHLAAKQDTETLLKGVRAFLEILDTKACQLSGMKRMHIKLDTCDELEEDSDAYWECYITHFARGANHVVGTAKMGPDDDKKAVVDGSLKVRGVKGLRVIDASIMPEIVSAGTQAATVMIAERGSDFVKESWPTKSDV